MIQDGTTQQHGMTEPANGNAVIEIGGIRSDSVTLYAYHDENSNYRLDRRDDGRPAEGCCSPTIRREELSRAAASPCATTSVRHRRPRTTNRDTTASRNKNKSLSLTP